MAGKVRTWVWVVVAIVVVGILCVVAMAGIGFYFFSKHIETHKATEISASQDFEQIKARFAGQKPLIELDERGHFLRTNIDRATAANVKTPEHLYIQAFDPDDGRVVRMNIPFWLLRLKMRRTIDFNGERMDLEDLRLSIDDLERFGPTLIVDHTEKGGDRVLVWSQ